MEARIAELEAALAKTRGDTTGGTDYVADDKFNSQLGPSGQRTSPGILESSPEHEDDTIALAGDIDGLKVGDDGRISFHGPTSLFQLPSSLTSGQSNPTQTKPEADGRRERLINNAWRERAFEQLSTIPVCLLLHFSISISLSPPHMINR